MQAAAKENPFFSAKKIRPPSASTLKDATAKIYNQINTPFQKVFSISFAEAQTKVPELQLQKKPSKTERKQELRKIYRNAKEKIESSWATTSVER